MSWPIAFLLTQITEIIVALFLWKEAPKQKVILFVFLASALTHPIIWFIFPQFAREYEWNYNTFLLFAEGYAYGVEILWYMAMRVPRPILLSCAANTASFGLGLLIQTLT